MLARTIRQTAYIDNVLLKDVMIALEDADLGTILGLLLVLLPNLETLSMSDRHWNDDGIIFDSILESIVEVEEKIRDNGQIPAKRALSKLAELKLLGYRYNCDDGGNDFPTTQLNPLIEFTSIPSLRSITGSQLGPISWTLSGPTARGSSNLECLRIEESTVRCAELDAMLESCKATKRFSFVRSDCHFSEFDDLIPSLLNTPSPLWSIFPFQCATIVLGGV